MGSASGTPANQRSNIVDGPLKKDGFVQPSGKVKLYNKETKKVSEHYPIDAKELIESGEYTTAIDGEENPVVQESVNTKDSTKSQDPRKSK